MQIDISPKTELWLKESLISLAILVGFWLAAKFVQYFLARWVSVFTKHTETKLDDKIVEAVKRPIYYIVLLSGVYLAISNQPLPPKVKAIGDGIVYVLGVGIAVMMVYRIVNVFLEWYTHNVTKKTDSQLEKEFLPLIEKLIFIFIFITGLIIVLKHFDYDILSLVTALGVTSLAIGLAAKDTLANMISGFTLMIDRPFRVGDRVQLVSGEVGDVVEIGIRSTKIKTMDSNALVVPNTELVNTKVINQCYPDKTIRGRVKVGIACNSDVDKAKKIMLDIAASNKKVLNNPAPIVLFTEFGDSTLILQMFYWIENCFDLFIIQDEINSQIKKRFEQGGIEIPYPVRTIYVKEAKLQ
ncbi:MAG: mechanosensitive ion channel protein MscS [Deltaproteobacteria bacterium RIFCSPLOWO2_12_FULL_43_16]|nr:MAG: mechanosensitive ion channel protein MscS [Deltaproteobacteria bacterium GWA2_43_19]OGQ12976.1 MAG: mechanosensitive ion channel protein MscS [Deltaproteobacteria bacterium RIFCSPHIGHO2_02_FULL_43_33]OGQ42703.1 MAG: mechanosensitive ion channel protein MscS [Deltaproteobacteria bacterium RIFCSPLOWO2_01_FULL_42_9]OGQ58406.1 MAG: mechanosensitive ion channel protein MscS [Deltaproteobacteria bacterium RIFCSPLOWO2_12_FULL_43_16]HBR16464.1 mechanosensitive ion channel protein MscS [Deltapro